MEPAIAISTINDFLYCPRSLYMHLAAGDIMPATYHAAPQKRGQEVHAAIEERRYSHRQTILQAKAIASQELQIQGKLDTFNSTTGELVERKTKITQIHEGNRLQLYAQYYCLLEMGYTPRTLAIYSVEDNKKYLIPLPKSADKARLQDVIRQMQAYTPEQLLAHHCPNCDTNIYSPLSW